MRWNGFRAWVGLSFFPAQFLGETRGDQSGENEDGSNQFEVIGIETPAKRERDEQAEEDRSHDGSDDEESEAAGGDKGFADNDAGQSPDEHADAHLNISEALVLSEEGAA